MPHPTGSPGSGKRTNMDFIIWCSASKSCVSAKGTEIAPMMGIMSVYIIWIYVYKIQIYNIIYYIYTCNYRNWEWLCFWHVHVGIVYIEYELPDPLTTNWCRRQTRGVRKRLDHWHERLNHQYLVHITVAVAIWCYLWRWFLSERRDRVAGSLGTPPQGWRSSVSPVSAIRWKRWRGTARRTTSMGSDLRGTKLTHGIPIPWLPRLEHTKTIGTSSEVL